MLAEPDDLRSGLAEVERRAVAANELLREDERPAGRRRRRTCLRQDDDRRRQYDQEPADDTHACPLRGGAAAVCLRVNRTAAPAPWQRNLDYGVPFRPFPTT